MTLDLGELWERSNLIAVSNERLAQLIHDAEIEAGESDGPDELVLSLGAYNDGVLAALRELKERRSHG